MYVYYDELWVFFNWNLGVGLCRGVLLKCGSLCVGLCVGLWSWSEKYNGCWFDYSVCGCLSDVVGYEIYYWGGVGVCGLFGNVFGLGLVCIFCGGVILSGCYCSVIDFGG